MGTEGKLLVLAREDGVLEGVGLESRQKVETFELVNCSRAFFPLFVPSFVLPSFLPSFFPSLFISVSSFLNYLLNFAILSIRK